MSRIWDITLPYTNDLSGWPGAAKANIERVKFIAQGGPSNASRMTVSVHHGTHVDAPLHYVDGAGAVETMSLDVLIGPAQVVDVGGAPSISQAILESQGLDAGVERVLFKTSNSALWNDMSHEFYDQFVGVDADAASWMVARGIKLVGVDYLSVETYHTDEYPTHKILLGANVAVLEGLDLREVTAGTYNLICLPINIEGSDGAPARAVLTEI